ncbi:MAG TPA: hypothetical protein VJ798_07925 [Rhizomicrobium sp.]|nr:hypothetical protein [Rhizomicrobium sp.]
MIPGIASLHPGYDSLWSSAWSLAASPFICLADNAGDAKSVFLHLFPGASMKTAFAALALLLALPAYAQTKADPDTQTVEAVVEAFRASIVDRDQTRFKKLFLDENTVWQSVTGDKNLKEARKKKPSAVKVRIDPTNNPRNFIDEIAADKAQSEEQFRDVKIQSDGDIASVYFDYSFLADGKETNHGREAWQLVHTDDGWKIVSVIWSVNW